MQAPQDVGCFMQNVIYCIRHTFTGSVCARDMLLAALSRGIPSWKC